MKKDENITLIYALNIISRNEQTFNVALTYLVRASIRDNIKTVILKLYHKWWDDQYENIDLEFLPTRDPKTVKEALKALEKFYELELSKGDMLGLDTYDENLNPLFRDVMSSNEPPFSMSLKLKQQKIQQNKPK